MVIKPTNPQRDYRKGTMLGNLKGWEKDMEDRQTGKLPILDKEGTHSFEETEPELKGRFAPPPKRKRKGF